MPIPEEGRIAGHVLLDAVSSWDDEASLEQNLAAANLALDRLVEAGAVRVEAEGGDGPADDLQVSVDLEDLIGPTVMLLHSALGTRHSALALLEERGVDTTTAVVALRAGIDSVA